MFEIAGGAGNIVCDVNAGLNSSCWKRERPFRGGEKSEALKRAASFQSPNPFFLTLMQPSLIRHSLVRGIKSVGSSECQRVKSYI